MDIQCGGVPVHPGDVILADENGVVVIPPGELERVLVEAEPRQKREEWLRREILAGRPLSELTGAADRIRAKTQG